MTSASRQGSTTAKGRLFVVSGPSGVGKGTLVAAALRDLSPLRVSVSATTRLPRLGEVEGVTYYFKSKREFDELIEGGGLLEWAEVHGNRYGTPVCEVEKALANGNDLILEIDPQGYKQVKERMEDVISIFIAPPSLEELKKRLEHRGTEDDDSLKRRLRNAQVEMQDKDSYNVVIINDDLKRATQELIAVIKGYRHAKN